MSDEERYADLRLKSFWAKREGDKKKAATLLKQAEKIWETMSKPQRQWANREIMAQVIAKGMNHINEQYGW